MESLILSNIKYIYLKFYCNFLAFIWWQCDPTQTHSEIKTSISYKHWHATIHLLLFSHTHTQVRLGQYTLTFPDKLWVWMDVYVRHSVCVCVCASPIDRKRGHSVRRSDDWAADTGKKEADRRRNKEWERYRSLPNCQWVISLDHTQTHSYTQSEPLSRSQCFHVAGAVAECVCVHASVYSLWPFNLFDALHSSHTLRHTNTHRVPLCPSVSPQLTRVHFSLSHFMT